MSVIDRQSLSRRGFLGITVRRAAAATTGGVVLSASQPVSANYPVSYLNVRWMTQYLGQEQHNDLVTNCCGPACAVMIHAFWAGAIPTSLDLWNALAWLDEAYVQPKYRPYYNTQESVKTSIGDFTKTDIALNRNQIGQLIGTHYGLHYKYYRGNMVSYTSSQSSIGNLLTLVREGFPCIVGCSISAGQLSASGAPHFSIVIGFDGANVILQNSGTHLPIYGVKGDHETMSLKNFDATWASNGRIYVPVAPWVLY